MRLFGFLNRDKIELSEFELEQFEEMEKKLREWGFPIFELKHLEKIRKSFKDYIKEMKPAIKKHLPDKSDVEIIKNLRRQFQYGAIEVSVKSWKRNKSDSEMEIEIREMKKQVKEAKKSFRNLSEFEIDQLDKIKIQLIERLKSEIKKNFPGTSDDEAFKRALMALRQDAIERIIEFWKSKEPGPKSFDVLQIAAINGRLRALYLEDMSQKIDKKTSDVTDIEVLVEEFANIVLEEHWTRRFDKCFEGVVLPGLWTLEMAEYILQRHIRKYDQI